MKGETGSKLFFFLLLGSITSSFIFLFSVYIPRYDMLFQSYDEKMETFNFPYYKELIFIRENTEENSVILYLNAYVFSMGKTILYPQREAYYFSYSFTTSEEDVLNYLRDNILHYIIVDDDTIESVGFPLSTNTTYFTKITSESTYYLLKINRTAL